MLYLKSRHGSRAIVGSFLPTAVGISIAVDLPVPVSIPVAGGAELEYRLHTAVCTILARSS